MIVELLLVLVLVGVVLYYLNQAEKIDPAIRMLIRIVVIVACVLYVVRAFGLDMPIPRLRS